MNKSITRTKDDNQSDNMNSKKHKAIGRQQTFEPQYSKQITIGH